MTSPTSPKNLDDMVPWTSCIGEQMTVPRGIMHHLQVRDSIYDDNQRIIAQLMESLLEHKEVIEQQNAIVQKASDIIDRDKKPSSVSVFFTNFSASISDLAKDIFFFLKMLMACMAEKLTGRVTLTEKRIVV